MGYLDPKPPKEKWASLIYLGYPLFEVSDLGNVRMRDEYHEHFKPVKKFDDKKGVSVKLTSEGYTSKYRVDFLVGFAFLNLDENQRFTAKFVHLDGDRWNSALDNLRLITNEKIWRRIMLQNGNHQPITKHFYRSHFTKEESANCAPHKKGNKNNG